MTPLSEVCGDIAYYVGDGMFQKGIGNVWNLWWKNLEMIIGVSWQDFGSVCTDLLIKKLHHVTHHPLHNHLLGQLIARSGSVCLPSTTTSQCLSSFIPQAIRHHDANYKRGDVQIEM